MTMAPVVCMGAICLAVYLSESDKIRPDLSLVSGELDDPAKRIFALAILNAGQRIIEILRQLADLTTGNADFTVFPSQTPDRRHNRRRAGTESLFQSAIICGIKNILNGNAALVHRNTLVLGQLDDGIARYAAENRTQKRRRNPMRP